MARKTKRIKGSRDVESQLRANDWDVREGRGSHKVAYGPNGEHITYYETREFPKGFRCRLEKLMRQYGLLMLLFTIPPSAGFYAGMLHKGISFAELLRLLIAALV